MNKNKQQTVILKNFRMPDYEQIPDVGLYLDQVAKFINSFLTEFPDMQVTPSMISNYAKQKLIDRVNRKTYTRDQIAALIMIVLSKTVISIDHIRMMLEDLRSEDDSLETAYTSFCSSLINVLKSLSGENYEKMRSSADEKERMIHNIVTAIAHKMYVERYFEIRSSEL
ncbi:MAG: DUF1836 domain-containing protein [Erysipelotrichaceae bacterium]|nr:DUF1836 domain-containing protein [Erysipelotrichaceae bacterium]